MLLKEAPTSRSQPRYEGASLWHTRVQTGGGANPITVATPFKRIFSYMVVGNFAAPPGATGVVFGLTASGTNVLLERYSADASATPAWVDSTTDVLVDVWVLGEY